MAVDGPDASREELAAAEGELVCGHPVAFIKKDLRMLDDGAGADFMVGPFFVESFKCGLVAGVLFLAEGMDILLDAEDLLRKWREHPSERQELSALLEELTTLGRGAEMAELPQIDELCEALLDLYGAVEEGSLAVSERFFDEAEKAHEALIGMMDQVAAALQVSPQPERVEALRQLLAEAIDPNTLALLSPDVEGLQVVELDQATAELEQAEQSTASEEPGEPQLAGESFETIEAEPVPEAHASFSPADAELDVR